ncbi:MAG: hypothetical protein K8T91_11055 [Planctomycetes bacterium]|nr:hypothetical protein [Planctomycetota bacterium]
MTQPSRQDLEAALYDQTGEPVPITRIAIEPLNEGFRWTLYSGPRQIFLTEGTIFDIRSAMEATAILVESELGLPPPLAAYGEGK